AAAYLSGAMVNVSSGAQAVRARMARVTSQFFDVFGVAPIRGRLFDASEATPGAAPVVVISYGLWQRLFDGDAGILGRTLRVEEMPVPIVGVMPEGFVF